MLNKGCANFDRQYINGAILYISNYGSELFFDFEYLSYTFAGIAQRIIDGKSLELEEVNLIRQIEINKQEAISKFIEDSQSWEQIPGVVAEYILWMSLIRALKEYIQDVK